MTSVFISYRRKDTNVEGIVGRLHDFLASRLGDQKVFLDVHDMPYGADFEKHLTNKVQSADFTLVIIGQRWLQLFEQKKEGQQTDYLLEEIKSALEGPGRVIPILVGRKTMPPRQKIPAAVRKLASYHYLKLEHGALFHAQAEALLERIRGRGVRIDPKFLKRIAWVAVPASLMVAAVAVSMGSFGDSGENPDVKPGKPGSVVVEPPAKLEPPPPGEAPGKSGAAPGGPEKKVDPPAPGPVVVASRAEIAPFEDPNEAGKEILFGAAAGEERTFRLSDDCEIPFNWIPPGTFSMGDNHGDEKEKPEREVELTRGFWMSRYEVSVRDWAAVMDESMKGVEAELPRTDVSWIDLKSGHSGRSFFDRINDFAPEGWRYDLPTEAEWEYACLADGNPEHQSTVVAEQKRPESVSSGEPNGWGVHNLLGNVQEWCADHYQGTYALVTRVDPRGPANGNARVIRGGSYRRTLLGCDPKARDDGTPEHSAVDLGFRVVLRPLTLSIQ